MGNKPDHSHNQHCHKNNCFKMYLIRLLLLVVVFVHASFAARSFGGQCEKARRGQTYEKCEMECRSDGSCQEIAESETCSCEGVATLTAGTLNYQDGQIMPSTGGLNNQCARMSRRCTSCRGGSSSSARAEG